MLTMIKPAFWPHYFVTGRRENEKPAIAFERLSKQKNQSILV